jgi:hypothetical protein
MKCKTTSHSNCNNPEGCAWCGNQCNAPFYCCEHCYEADSNEFERRLDAMPIIDRE